MQKSLFKSMLIKDFKECAIFSLFHWIYGMYYYIVGFYFYTKIRLAVAWHNSDCFIH